MTPSTAVRTTEVADGIYQLRIDVDVGPSGFSFNQYLVVDDAPLLFHTGPRRMFPLVQGAVEKIIPVRELRYIGFSHCESDECGSMNEFLAIAPGASPVCGRTAARIDGDLFDRSPRALADGEVLVLGKRRVRWLDAPHLPHNWECGFLFEEQSATLFCGDLFTQPGRGLPAVTRGDILGPSEALRRGGLDYFAHAQAAPVLLEKLAATSPRLLACMHGQAYEGDGGALIRELARVLGASRGSAPGQLEQSPGA
ncbi:MBL fold metallo-hydrolase [Vitiosangium sp. GDMCC 1.1324]|uniref:MBL fold metallo-hydrolase n=1 Tax=Vitiosangium sp. (strain GDMCC 1.1324) TaxID=2138576 RepID=UPI000D38F357|nr:MBL fold metallo-hydrolase [Vitiosangium sp. GDMCC 1.1324]PTL82410.1 MBL fold metallo-hydrolase [Vitiosangium sp. GDMCC 1.1324]